jgi:hypothetical protein
MAYHDVLPGNQILNNICNYGKMGIGKIKKALSGFIR